MDTFRKHLKILRNDSDEEKSKKSASFFSKAARNGEDLSPVISDLIRIFPECNSIRIMEPLADALILHYLNKSDFKGLEELLKREDFRDFLLHGFCGLVKDNRDITGAIPFITGAIRKELFRNMSVGRILVSYIKKETKRLNEVVETMLREPLARVYLPIFLKECLIFEGINISSSLPLLAGLLNEKSGQVREDTSLTFSFASERGLSLTKVLPLLEKSLSDRNKGVCKNLAYGMALFFANRKRLEEIDRLMKHRSPSVRDGALRGTSVHFLRSKKHNPALLSRIALSLIDTDRRIRETSFTILEAAAAKGMNIEPERNILDVLFHSLKYETKRDSVVRYFYCFAGDNRERASLVLQGIQPFLDRGMEMIDNLGKACREIVSEEHIRACTICENIPRSGTSWHEEGLSEAIKYLEPAESFKKCPQCGTYYIYDYSVEYDVASCFETYSIQRLRPTEALKKLRGEELGLLQENYGAIIERNIKNLNHFDGNLRKEGAWVLTLHYIDRGEAEKINDLLLSHSDPSVRLETLETLERSDFRDIVPLAQTLTRLLSDEDRKIRKSAGTILSRQIHEEE